MEGRSLDTKNIGILLAGGCGIRFGSPLPKQLHKMGGRSIYLYALETFLQTKLFDRIIIPTLASYQEEVRQEVSSLYPGELIDVILGGSSRQESSYLGLQACPKGTKYVVIHDAIRPFVSQKIIRENLEAAKEHGAVDTCIPSADTLVYAPDGAFIRDIPSRKEFFRGQTPQTFSFDTIFNAHKQAVEDNILNASDDCSLVSRLGLPVKVLLGEDRNIKITTELDLFLAEQILRLSHEEEIFLEEKSLDSKVFAITGASGGIGKVLSEKLRKRGATILEISQKESPLQADLTNYEEVEKIFQQIASVYGKIDGLINGVGSLQVKEFDLLSQEEMQETVDANLMSIIYCCKCAQIKEGGHIVNISSSSYSKGRKDYPIYSASKAAVVNFTQGLAEARPELCINVVVPQRTDTPLRRKHFPLEDANSLLKPEEIADKISNLLTSSHTGSIIEIRKRYEKGKPPL